MTADRQAETLAAVERATALAELYGNAIIKISEALRQNASGGGVMKARAIIASLDTAPAATATEAASEVDERLIDKWMSASQAARKAEYHFPADCLAEAVEVYRRLATPPADVVPAAGGLRDVLDEQLPDNARMDAYYYSFDRTGVGVIDAILSQVAIAGKAFHHTENWQDEDARHFPVSHQDRIQEAANTAARRLRALLPASEPDDATPDERESAAQRIDALHDPRNSESFTRALTLAAAVVRNADTHYTVLAHDIAANPPTPVAVTDSAGEDERDALALLYWGLVTGQPGFDASDHRDGWRDRAHRDADAILASDWLAARDARIKAEAVEQIARAIEAEHSVVFALDGKGTFTHGLTRAANIARATTLTDAPAVGDEG